MRNIKLTPEGHKKLQDEYNQLQEKRKEAVKELSIARDMGDRSENAFYKTARSKLSSIDRELVRLGTILKFGQVVGQTKVGEIEIGSKVKLFDGNVDREFTIVGGYETDIEAGKISYFSPIGKALLGKRVDDIVVIKIPAGTLTYKILEIV
jgi:transcription elongation factor GreA